jgi:hypothetical protein
MGIDCSISRHALIFKRRQTQHKSSLAVAGVSAPQTEHFESFLSLSVLKDSFACSSISAAITASTLGCIFLLMETRSDFTMAETAPANN